MAKCEMKFKGDSLKNKRNLHSIAYIQCSFDFDKILSEIILSPLPTQIINQNKQINLFLVFYRHVV